MKDEKKEITEKLERYLFLLKSLKEDKMEEKIDEEYLKYISLAKKEKNNNANIGR